MSRVLEQLKRNERVSVAEPLVLDVSNRGVADRRTSMTPASEQRR